MEEFAISELPQAFDALELLSQADSPAPFVATMGPGRAGVSLVRFANDGNHVRNRELASSLLSALGSLVSVYPSAGVWSDLSVRLDANPIRTHGVGENPFHMDLVDRDLMPRYIAIYCERSDPGGGGFTSLADMWRAASRLSEDELGALKVPAYSYFSDDGVYGVGESLERFSILPGEIGPGEAVRFTSKMLPHLESGIHLDDRLVDAKLAVQAFKQIFCEIGEPDFRIRLEPSELIVFDQLRYAHSRSPLASNQHSFAPGTRRLLKQTYIRDLRIGPTR